MLITFVASFQNFFVKDFFEHQIRQIKLKILIWWNDQKLQATFILILDRTLCLVFLHIWRRNVQWSTSSCLSVLDCRWSYLPLHKWNFCCRILHGIMASPTDVVVIKTWHDVSQKLYNLVHREIAYFCDSLHILIFVLHNMSQQHKSMLLVC